MLLSDQEKIRINSDYNTMRKEWRTRRKIVSRLNNYDDYYYFSFIFFRVEKCLIPLPKIYPENQMKSG